jgi:nicotinate-nucleotide pyrophosphorylase (carboxylating)
MMQNTVPQVVIDSSVRAALSEDVGSGDLTAQLIDAEAEGSAVLITREAMCLCGTAWFDTVFAQIDARVHVQWNYQDGDWVEADMTLCTLTGASRALLTGERTAMNFVQMLSGTATVAHGYAQWLKGSRTHLLDTRKTIPGHRLAQKYAVRCGGGTNHRIGLFDAFLIKENHIAAAGSIALAIQRAQAIAPGKAVEVEVETLAQLEEAIVHGADIIMLDNFDDTAVEQAVQITAQRAKLEISGNVDEARVKRMAQSGVDYISVGALTKHVRAIDLSMRFSGAVKKN